MRSRTLPGTEIAVSVVGLGCNNFGGRIDADATEAVIDAAIEGGITLFDTAESYGVDGESERLLGRYVSGRREQVVIATKFGWWNDPADTGALGRPSKVRRAVEGSLTRLRTDYIDLYQYHRPDRVTPIVETLGVLNALIAEGKVRAIGASNMTAPEILEADRVARDNGLVGFASIQNEYSWLERGVEAEVIGACELVGAGLIPYFPLASGLLTGKYQRGAPAPAGTRLAAMGDRLATTSEATWNCLERITAWAEENDVSVLEVAIGGLAQMPAVTSVIAGATAPEQIAANVAAGSWIPTPQQLETLRRITGGDDA